MANDDEQNMVIIKIQFSTISKCDDEWFIVSHSLSLFYRQLSSQHFLTIVIIVRNEIEKEKQRRRRHDDGVEWDSSTLSFTPLECCSLSAITHNFESAYK